MTGPVDRSIPLGRLGLQPGAHNLEMEYVDSYGTASDRTSVLIQIDDANAGQDRWIEPSSMKANPRAAGVVELEWHAVDRTGQLVVAAAWEVADHSDLDTILTTAVGTIRQAVWSINVGPLADGMTARLAIRASDGVVAGERGDWHSFAPVLVDSSPPDVPSPIISPRKCF